MTSAHSSRYILKETVVYGAGTVISQILSALRGMMVAALLGPAGYGFWKVIQVGLDYLGYTHFGIMHGMAMQIPIYRASGEVEKERISRRITLGLTLSTALIAGSVTALATLPLPREVWLAWLGVAGVLLPTQLFRFLHMTCLADGRFAVLSGANVLMSVVAFIGMAWWIPSYGLTGVFLGLGVGYWVGILFGWVRGIYPWPPRMRWLNVRSIHVDPLVIPLIRNGFPFMCVDGLFVVWQGVDRLALATIFGANNDAMGHYGLSVMIASFAIQIPQVVNRVLFRRTISGFVDVNQDSKNHWVMVRRHIDIPALAAAGWSPIIFCLCLVGSTCMIHLFLPEYQAAIPLVAWQLAACYWCSVGLLVRNVFTATKRQWRLGQYYLLAIIATVGTIYAMRWLVPAGAGLGVTIGGIGSLAGAVLAALCSLIDLGCFFRYGARRLVGVLAWCLIPFIPYSLWMIHFISSCEGLLAGAQIAWTKMLFELLLSLGICLPAALWTLWKIRQIHFTQSHSAT